MRIGKGPDIAFRDVPLPALAPLWLVGGFVVVFVFRTYPAQHWFGADAHAYWMTARSANLYGIAPGFRDAFNYSPAFAQVIYPLALLPWPLFYGVWTVIEGAAFAWLLAPLGWRWAIPLWCCCVLEIAFGNIMGLLTAAFVVGLRRPGTWAFALLTKITPGVGLLWFAVRRDWRSLGIAAGTTVVSAAASFALQPYLWSAWFHYLDGHQGDAIALRIRVAVASTLVVVVALTGRLRVLLIAALMLSVPMVNGWLWITMLAGIPRLRQPPAEQQPADAVRGVTDAATAVAP